MAEQHSGEGSSTGGASVSSSESSLELKIKTLDSRIYTFHVDKNMPVSLFKGKIADQVGVPMGQQRLIFRGKVLKDEHLLSEYYVENGDTLHLVERQPAQQQTSSGTGYADTSTNNGSQGSDASAGVPRNRIGQISHNVVLGTFNVGDQGEGAAPDLTRVIGAVLNSLGVGSQPTAIGSNGVGVQAAASSAAPQGNNVEQVHGITGATIQAQSPFGQPFFTQPLHVPLIRGSVTPPSLNMPIPDSLSTLSEFISRMEEVLSRNGYQPTPSSFGSADQPMTELPSNTHGFPTPEALSVVLRHTQRLLSGVTVSALSHIAGQLEQEGGSTDTSVRSQIQNDSVQVGLAMQHLGALFLEIGRTMLMLRMGQSPAEAVVSAGPAVYISQSGPNPIMVQPFPHQTSPLFIPRAASTPNSDASIPVGIIGSAPRNVNIHIHAGTSVPAMVSSLNTRGAGGEGAQNEQVGVTAPGDSGAARVPVRNVIANAVPSRTATIAVTPGTSGSENIGGVSASQPAETASIVSEINSHLRSLLENMQTGSLSSSGPLDNSNSSVGSGGAADTAVPSRTATITVTPVTSGSQNIGGVSTSQPAETASTVSDINSHIRSLLENMRTGSESPSGQLDNSNSSVGSAGVADTVDPSRSMHSLASGEASQSRGSMPEQKTLDSNNESPSVVEPSPSMSGIIAENAESNMIDLQASGDSSLSSNARDVPLGLGGGLQPKRRGQLSKKSSGNGTSCTVDQSQQASANGQQILQSLLCQSTATRTSSDVLGTAQNGQGFGPGLAAMRSGAEGSEGQVDVTGVMSQVLDSPALNGLLSGVAQQTGVGSPDMLRNMLQQFTQNPAMMNTVNQLAQQVDGEGFRNMFGGMGAGQGSLDLSGIVQQMMPVVSQVLGGASFQNDQEQTLLPEMPPQVNRRLIGDDVSVGQSFQIDTQEVVQQIAAQSSSQDIFRAVVESAMGLSGIVEELVEALSSNEELVDLFMEVLRSDLLGRVSGGKS